MVRKLASTSAGQAYFISSCEVLHAPRKLLWDSVSARYDRFHAPKDTVGFCPYSGKSHGPITEDMPVPKPRPPQRGADKRTILRDHYLFGELTPQNIDRLCACMVTKTVKRGTNIWAKGDPGTGLCAIGAGTVKISFPSVDGRAVFNVLGEGAIIGEITLLDGKPEIALKLIESLCSRLRAN